MWGRRDPVTFHPDLGWLREAMAVEYPPRLVVLVNPCNPTGRWGAGGSGKAAVRVAALAGVQSGAHPNETVQAQNIVPSALYRPQISALYSPHSKNVKCFQHGTGAKH